LKGSSLICSICWIIYLGWLVLLTTASVTGNILFLYVFWYFKFQSKYRILGHKLSGFYGGGGKCFLWNSYPFSLKWMATDVAHCSISNRMFQNAQSFNQDISGWDVSKVCIFFT
jgi:surface protein